jgi:hypothetical protein
LNSESNNETTNAIAQAALSTKSALKAICDTETSQVEQSELLLSTLHFLTNSEKTFERVGCETKPQNMIDTDEQIETDGNGTIDVETTTTTTTSASELNDGLTIVSAIDLAHDTANSSVNSSSTLTPVNATIKPNKRRQSLQFLVSTVPTLHRNLMKRKSEVNLQSSLAESQTKVSCTLSCCSSVHFDYVHCLLMCFLFSHLCPCSWTNCTKVLRMRS